MPPYNFSPLAQPPTLLQPGWPHFLIGGLPRNVSPTTMQVTSVELAADIATIGVVVSQGNIPVVGSPITVTKTATDAGEFNVTSVLTAVAINTLTGIGTVSYALTAANQATTPDAGLAIVPAPMMFEALANGSSVPATLPAQEPLGPGAAITAQVFFGAIPTDVVVSLEGALVNQDSAYQVLGPVSTVSASAVNGALAQFPAQNVKFLRFTVSGLTGAGTLAACLLP
jgi:hypothetical protein